MLNRLFGYFDLQSEKRKVVTEGHDAGEDSNAGVLPQYATVSIGVILEPLLRKYVESGAWNFDWSTFGGRTVFGLVVGIILLPAVYKSSFDPQRPIIVQLAALFPLGIGWQTIFTSATKIASQG